MNQEKIGKFIQEKRKEKNMTQLELGGNLGVSEKTISNWENGRNMPDLSMFKPLCDELGVSINDLLNGEIVKEEDKEKVLEENMANILKYTDKKSKNKIKKIIIFVVAIIVTLIGTIIYLEMNSFQLSPAYPSYPNADINEKYIYQIIKDNILMSMSSIENEDESNFAKYEILSIEKKSKNHYYVYAWIVESKYSYINGELNEESGSSYPCRYELEEDDRVFTIVGKDIPRDGDYYKDDIDSYFPVYLREKIFNSQENGLVKDLSDGVEEEAKSYFENK